MIEIYSNVRIKGKQQDLIKRQREKEGCQSTQPSSSKGIEMDPNLEWCPIPPLWHWVVSGTTCARHKSLITTRSQC